MSTKKPQRVPIYCGTCGQPKAYVLKEAVDRGGKLAGHSLVPASMILSQLVSLSGFRCDGCERVENARGVIRP